MIRAAILAAVLPFGAGAFAQALVQGPTAQTPIVATPLPAPDDARPVEAEPRPGAKPAAAPGFPDRWLARDTAVLVALDKVNARSASIAVKVGQTARFQTLTIEVKSCLVRPAEQPADAAAAVVVVDSRGQDLGFSGWLLRSMPSVSMMGHPIYDLRVAGCGA